MNAAQSGATTCLATIVQQAISGRWDGVALFRQVTVAMLFIAPVVSAWFGVILRLRQHWVVNTLLDQFVVSPLFNIGIFHAFALLSGGLTFGDDGRRMSISLHRSRFASPFEYEPIWATQLKSYLIWLPATIIREAFVLPPHKPLFSNLVSFVWSICFAFIMASAA